MNPYAVIGSGLGTAEAVSLAIRLSAWHDAMVAHERRLRSTASADGCHDECPHVEARTLWAEALDVFGPQAHELTFLRSRGHGVATATRAKRKRREEREGAIDEAIAESFPASDPPAWNPGLARLSPGQARDVDPFE